MENSTPWHIFKNLLLLILSVVFLPIDTVIAGIALLWTKLGLEDAYHDNESKIDDPLEEITVLVTGVNMAKGMTVARMFHRAGHRVIGADFHALAVGRISRAVDKYYHLPPPSNPSQTDVTDRYLNRMVEIVNFEHVDLWISVSDVNAAVEDAAVKEIIEARTGAKAIQLGVDDLRVLHEKNSFIEHCRKLGLRVPDTQAVERKSDVIEFLQKRGGLTQFPGQKQYLLKPIGVDDISRFDMPLLPLSSEACTLESIELIPFNRTPDLSFIMQEYISGQEYCTHALVIRGRVRAFVACPSAGVLMHYTALPDESPLTKAMLEFTIKLAEAGGEGFTGHVSFDFLVRDTPGAEKEQEEEEHMILYPIECNPRVHTAIVLFSDTPELVDEYLSILKPASPPFSSFGALPHLPLTPRNPKQYYWAGQDLVELVLHPIYQTLFSGQSSMADLKDAFITFINHVLYWKDGTFEVWDPFPWWWLHHVYWPTQFAKHLFSDRWHKLNVSTGKVFKAK